MSERDIITLGNVEEDGLTVLSVSRLKKWRHCQQAHDWKYVEKLQPLRKSLPLTRGSWLHSLLEARDSGQDWQAVLKELKTNEYDPLFAEEKVELGNLPMECYRIMRNYNHHYKDEPFKIVLKTEFEFKVRIPKTPFVLHGIIDKLARDDNGKLWCIEHKTVKRQPSEDFRQTDIQTALYLWAMRKLAPILGYYETEVGGVVFDYLLTKPPTIPQLLKSGQMSKRAIWCDVYTYIAELKKHDLDPADYTDMWPKLRANRFFIRQALTRSDFAIKNILNDAIRTGYQIRALSGKTAVMSLGWACERPKCEFRDLCWVKVENGDLSAIINAMYERRD